jgi:hypothetical protein
MRQLKKNRKGYRMKMLALMLLKTSLLMFINNITRNVKQRNWS